jgi:hypothetical protein
MLRCATPSITAKSIEISVGRRNGLIPLTYEPGLAILEVF